MSALLQRFPLLTVVPGMSNGGEARAVRWTGDGARLLGKSPVGISDRDNGRWYNASAFPLFWEEMRPELGNTSLLQLILTTV